MVVPSRIWPTSKRPRPSCGRSIAPRSLCAGSRRFCACDREPCPASTIGDMGGRCWADLAWLGVRRASAVRTHESCVSMCYCHMMLYHAHVWPAVSAMRAFPHRSWATPIGSLTMQPITDVHELFRHQRAIRNFTPEDVPDALVNQVLTAAIHGPSGSNTQPWHFIVIRDPSVKNAISEVYEEARAAAG